VAKLGRLIALALGCLLLTGCETIREHSLTGKLWNNGDLAKFREPPPYPHLNIYADDTKNDLLVEYNEAGEGGTKTRRRSYYLRENEARLVEKKKPHFVSNPDKRGLRPLPIVLVPEVSTNPPAGPWQVAAEKEDRVFTIYESTNRFGPHDLPVYANASGTAIKVGLTPLAVVGDVTIVAVIAGGIAFVAALYGMAGGGR
jgi:hypothetical protein